MKIVQTLNFLDLDEVEKHKIVGSFSKTNTLDFCLLYGIRKLTLDKMLKDGKDVLDSIEHCSRTSFVHGKFKYINKTYNDLVDFAKIYDTDYSKVYWGYVTGIGIKDFVYTSSRY